MRGTAGLLLTTADRSHGVVLMRRQMNGAVRRRISVLWLRDGGWTAERVGEADRTAAAKMAALSEDFRGCGPMARHLGLQIA